MKLVIVAGTCMLLMMVSGCASTNENSSVRKSTGQTLVNEKGEVTHLCHIEKPTGSRIGERVCRTLEQIELERAAAREETLKMQQIGTTTPVSG